MIGPGGVVPGIQGRNGPLEIDQKHGLPIGSPIAVALKANPMLETGDGDQGSVRGNHDQIASDAGLNGTPHDTHRRHGFDRCDHGVSFHDQTGNLASVLRAQLDSCIAGASGTIVPRDILPNLAITVGISGTRIRVHQESRTVVVV